jgi:DNA polymerase elongation subunit (family B)
MGNRILHRWFDGVAHQVSFGHVPVDLFIKGDGEYKSLHDESLTKRSFNKISDAKDFVKQYKGVSNFEIHGNQNWEIQAISNWYPDDIDWDIENLVIANIDIENLIGSGGIDAHGAKNPITVITVGVSGKYHVFAYADYEVTDESVFFTKCKNEKELLLRFLIWWKQLEPHVITGWNISGYDIPYLINRIKQVLGEEFVSWMAPTARRYNKQFAVSSSTYFTDEPEYKLAGIAILDYLKIYKTFTFKERDNYKLDTIAKVELDSEKLDYSEYKNLDDLYVKNPQKYIDYNIHDVRLVDMLDDKMQLLMLVFFLAYKSKIPYDDVFSQIRMWDSYIYNELKKSNVVVPPKKHNSKSSKYAGAVVFDPKIGLHDWVVSYDLDSLYPHLMMQYNISPEVLIDKVDIGEIESIIHKKINMDKFSEDGKYIVASNGARFRKDKDGILPIIMENIYAERKVIKEKMLQAEQKTADAKNPTELKKYENEYSKYKTFQLGAKVYLNSAYGMLGNEYSRYYDVRIAEAITLSGQLSIQWISERINLFLNEKLKTGNYDYILAGDTDSTYFTLEKLIDKLQLTDIPKCVSTIDKFCEKYIQPMINDSYNELAKYMNVRKQAMHMSREVIARRGLWRKKKNYALDVYNSEGVSYSNGKLKIMGIEAVRSSTPEPCRNAIKKSLEIILRDDESSLQVFVKKFKNEFHKYAPHEIASVSGISDITKWYVDDTMEFRKGTPIHVKASLIYNSLIDKYDLLSKYDYITDGVKIKYIYLHSANPTFNNCIAFMDVLPPEFKLESYIDYDLQFDKTFKFPLESLTGLIGWQVEKTMGLFG